MEHYNRLEAVAAQKRYCQEHEVPHFAPDDGYCYHCDADIYAPITIAGRTYGITVEHAGKTLITGCPHCNYSFVK